MQKDTAERFCYCKMKMMVANQKCIFLNTTQLAFSTRACFRIKKNKKCYTRSLSLFFGLCGLAVAFPLSGNS